jgi:hypothetical protein
VLGESRVPHQLAKNEREKIASSGGARYFLRQRQVNRYLTSATRMITPFFFGGEML